MPELSQGEHVRIAASISAEIVSDQAKTIDGLKCDLIRLRAALGSIHINCRTITGRDAVQALLDRGMLKPEDVA